MIPKKIHFTIPENPSKIQLQNIQRARECNPDFEIIVWQDPLSASDFSLGCYFERVNSGAQLADLLRLSVIEKHGGIYLDSDMVCTRSFDQLTRYCEFCCASEDGTLLTNAFFAAPADHPATLAIVSELLKHEPNWEQTPDVSTGPHLFSRLLKSRADVRIIPRVLFYPYNWNEKPSEPHPHTLATHAWDHSWGDLTSTTGRSSKLKLKSSRLGKSIRRVARPTALWLESRFSAALSRTIDRFVKRYSHPPRYSCTEVIGTKLSGGITIFIDGNDVSITPDLLLRGSYEPVEEKFVESVLHGGDWFVDVGTNVGIFSLRAAARVGPFGRVWSFEPNKNLHPLLRKSLIANWFHERVTVEPCAVGDQPGTANLEIPEGVLGGAHISDGNVHQALNSPSSGNISEEVEIRTLDGCFDELALIRILKIDVEGHEANVLRGGKRLFAGKQVDYVLIEVINIGDEGAYYETISELNKLVDMGYQCGYLSGSSAFVGCASVDESLRMAKSRNLVLANPAIL